jgi:hypothetical protein
MTLEKLYFQFTLLFILNFNVPPFRDNIIILQVKILFGINHKYLLNDGDILLSQSMYIKK